ncbi:MAG: GNAT family N-acetyltransferase [Rhodospirillales bacterium]
MEFREDDLSGEDTIALVRAHLAHMAAVTPADSIYALDHSGLQAADVTFWSVWDGCTIIGCAALREIDPHHGEIKSMHTVAERRGTGIARRVLDFVIDEAQRRGYRRLSLETGHSAAFEAAQRLYAGAGFTPTGPFADYGPDPHSFFMTLELDQPFKT